MSQDRDGGGPSRSRSPSRPSMNLQHNLLDAVVLNFIGNKCALFVIRCLLLQFLLVSALCRQAKLYDWDLARALLEANPRLVNTQAGGRWSALHQAAEALGDCRTAVRCSCCAHVVGVALLVCMCVSQWRCPCGFVTVRRGTRPRLFQGVCVLVCCCIVHQPTARGRRCGHGPAVVDLRGRRERHER